MVGRSCETMPGMKRLLALLMATFLLTACGSDSEPDDSKDDSGSDDASSEQVAEIVEYGFGQRDQYVYAPVIIKGTAEKAGQFVTVSANALDESGEIIATETQVEQITSPGQELVAAVFFDLGAGAATVADLEVTLTSDDEGDSTDEPDLGTAEATSITEQYGTTTAAAEFENTTNDTIDLNATAVCRDTAGTIIGGAFTSHGDVAAGSTALVDVDVTVSSPPATCTIYFNDSSI